MLAFLFQISPVQYIMYISTWVFSLRCTSKVYPSLFPSASIGGFCVDPGECICRTGYFGELCKNRSELMEESRTVKAFLPFLNDYARLNFPCFGHYY